MTIVTDDGYDRRFQKYREVNTMKYPADLMVSFVEAVGNCSYEERFFIVQKINKLFDKNPYKLLVNHDGEYTNIGMLLGAFREVLLFSIVK